MRGKEDKPKVEIPTFLKWVGGKRQLLSSLQREFPEKINRYFEPFLGGGSVFFFVKQEYNPRYCMVSDINKDLVATYIAVRDKPQRLIKHLEIFRQNDSKDFFYETRKKFNENGFRRIRRCAAFIYLNKTCFNGVYRVNSKNKFNVPYAGYHNPTIFSKNKILHASSLLKGVKIKVQDYREIVEKVKGGDFVYLDPCYDPIKRTSFDKYTPKRFSEEDRIELAKFIKRIRDRGANAALSNSNSLQVKEYYLDFKKVSLPVRRFVNSNGKGREETTELLVKSYE